MNRAMLVSTRSRAKLRKNATLEDNSRRGTPKPYFDWFHAMFRFTVDVCADPGNAKLKRYWSETENGLEQSWRGERFFCNPPYGPAIWQWLARARDACFRGGREQAMGMLLLPHRADTAWWGNNVMQEDGRAGRLLSSSYDPSTRVHWYSWDRLQLGWYVHDERITFEGEEDSAPFPSAFVFMGTPGSHPPKCLATPRHFRNGEWSNRPNLLVGWPR